jgi:hypothetical protein
MAIMSYSLRSGSQNDKSVFNMSNFGRNFHKIIPKGRVFLADAGYKLLKNILTPYKIQIGMPSDEAKYNY